MREEFMKDERNNKNLRLLFFQGEDCGLCQGMEIKVKRELSSYKLPLDLIELKTHPKLRGEYGVYSFPTLLLLEGDKEIERTSGFFDLERIKRFLDLHKSL
nr:thioredoxin family protein [Peptoniphilus catoniae]